MKAKYDYPINLSQSTKGIIDALINPDPSQRPTMENVIEMDFFKEYVPLNLPVSVLTTAPRFDCLPATNNTVKDDLMKTIFMDDVQITTDSKNAIICPNDHLKHLDKQLDNLFNGYSIVRGGEDVLQNSLDLMAANECPSLVPVYWVSKWVDFSDKCGLAYKLSDSSTGVFFNDGTKLILTENKKNIQYIEANNTEYLYTTDNFPENMRHKRITLSTLEDYMDENLVTVSGVV